MSDAGDRSVARQTLTLLDELARFAERAPDLVREARAGRGPVGRR